jgi:hypothetical protein
MKADRGFKKLAAVFKMPPRDPRGSIFVLRVGRFALPDMNQDEWPVN